MLMTTNQYAEYVQMHPNTIRRLSNEGKLDNAVRIGGKWRFRVDEVNEWPAAAATTTSQV